MRRRAKNQPVDRGLLGIVLILLLFGLIAISSASAVLSFERFGNTNYYFFRQIIFVVVGLVAMFIFSKIDYHVWRRWAKPIFLFSLLALAVVLVPQIGFESAGARRWINTGFVLIQPSEFAKLAIIFYLASWFERKKGAEQNFIYGILPPLIVIGVLLALVVIEPDLGSASMLGVVVFVMLYAAGVRLKYLAGLAGLAIASLFVLIRIAPYRAARLITFLDPSLDPRGIGYHINQALLAIGSGGLIGLGLGDSLQKHNYLPEPIGDSIFAVVAEELGFIRIIFIIALFLAFGIVGMKVARAAPDKFGNLVGVGITSWIVLQAFFNIGAISGILPLTGVVLPFISYGGSSLLSTSIGVGILLNISRQRV